MIQGFLWDLDGVLTNTSTLHRDSWIEALSNSLTLNDSELLTASFQNMFTGVPRAVGIRRFLQSINENGQDCIDIETQAVKIAKYKNDIFVRKLHCTDIEVFPDALDLLSWSQSVGLKNGLASQSENADAVIDVTNLRKYLDACATGITAREAQIESKPHHRFYEHAAEKLGVNIESCICFEDTYAGIYSAVTAKSAMCIGVARDLSSSLEIMSAGADLVTRDLKSIKMLLLGIIEQ